MKLFCFFEQQEQILKTLKLLSPLETLTSDEEFLARKSEVDIFILFGAESSAKLPLLQRFLIPPQSLIWITTNLEFEKNLNSIPVGTLFLIKVGHL